MQTDQRIAEIGKQIDKINVVNHTSHLLEKVYNFSKKKVNRKALKGLSPHRAIRHKLAFYISYTDNDNKKPRKLKKLYKQVECKSPITANMSYIINKVIPRYIKYAICGSDITTFYKGKNSFDSIIKEWKDNQCMKNETQLKDLGDLDE